MPKIIAPQEDREFEIGGETFKYAPIPAPGLHLG